MIFFVNSKTGDEATAEVSEDEIRARLNKLQGVDRTATTSLGGQQNILVAKPAESSTVQADKLFQQIGEQIEIEKNMPNPDDELEERLARLKGVDVEQVRHPGKGLDTDPLDTKEDSLLLHDHSSYTIVNSGEEHEEGLAKEIFEINKEVRFFFSSGYFSCNLY